MDTREQPDPARLTLRASDTDRERVAELLRESFSSGRITMEELQERLDQAYGSKTLGELDLLTADLQAPGNQLSQPSAGSVPDAGGRPRKVRDHVLTYLLLMLFLIAIWAVSGRHGSFWPIWPILIGAFVLAFDVLGLERPGDRRRRRRMEEDRRHRERRERRMDRRPGEHNDRE